MCLRFCILPPTSTGRRAGRYDMKATTACSDVFHAVSQRGGSSRTVATLWGEPGRELTVLLSR